MKHIYMLSTTIYCQNRPDLGKAVADLGERGGGGGALLGGIFAKDL